jgi:hypothetical protein
MFYGDSMVTPAVSVLSAVEGLRQISMKFDPFVVPAALAILVALFAFQRHGSGRPLVRTSDGRVVPRARGARRVPRRAASARVARIVVRLCDRARTGPPRHCFRDPWQPAWNSPESGEEAGSRTRGCKEQIEEFASSSCKGKPTP